jgi:hypothetical protein
VIVRGVERKNIFADETERQHFCSGTPATTARQVRCHLIVRVVGARGAVGGDFLEIPQSGSSRAAAMGRQGWETDPS